MKIIIIIVYLFMLCSCNKDTGIDYVTLDEAKVISKNTLNEYLNDNNISSKYTYNRYLDTKEVALYTGNENDIILSYIDSNNNEILVLVSSDKMHSNVISDPLVDTVNADCTDIKGYYKYEDDSNYYEITEEGNWLYYNDKDEDLMDGSVVYKDNKYVFMIDDIDMLVLEYDNNKFIDESNNVLTKFEK